MEKLLEELFKILGFSEDEKTTLTKLLEETLTYNLAASVINDLNETQIASFQAHIKANGLDEKTFSEWFAKNIGADKDALKEKLRNVVAQTFRDFFEAITKNISDDKKQQALSFLDTASL